MSVQLLEPAADALGPLLDRVVFLGGATVALWLSDPGARRPRVTFDVDVVAEVTTLLGYSEFQADLRSRGFREDIDSGVICRWRHDERGVILNAVPLEHRLAGFSGRWLAAAVAEPTALTLPSGASVRTVRPSWLLTTKLEAFADRGKSDCLKSRDFEDIVTLVDGREELAAEVEQLPADARSYVVAELRRAPTWPALYTASKAPYRMAAASGRTRSRSRGLRRLPQAGDACWAHSSRGQPDRFAARAAACREGRCRSRHCAPSFVRPWRTPRPRTARCAAT